VEADVILSDKATFWCSSRNTIPPNFCPLQAGSTSIVEGEKEAWWLDDRTKRLIEETMHLSGALTFTVRPGTPLQLTREQVSEQC